jgi:hypothetical protein
MKSPFQPFAFSVVTSLGNMALNPWLAPIIPCGTCSLACLAWQIPLQSREAWLPVAKKLFVHQKRKQEDLNLIPCSSYWCKPMLTNCFSDLTNHETQTYKLDTALAIARTMPLLHTTADSGLSYFFPDCGCSSQSHELASFKFFNPQLPSTLGNQNHSTDGCVFYWQRHWSPLEYGSQSQSRH